MGRRGVPGAEVPHGRRSPLQLSITARASCAYLDGFKPSRFQPGSRRSPLEPSDHRLGANNRTSPGRAPPKIEPALRVFVTLTALSRQDFTKHERRTLRLRCDY